MNNSELLSLRGEVRRHSSTTEIPYFSGITVGQFLREFRKDHPALVEVIDPARMASQEAIRIFESIGDFASHFDGKHSGNRGEVYRRTQKANPLIRARGIKYLFDLIIARNEYSPELIILDALGGNGTLTRTMRAITGELCPAILTSDASVKMVEDALSQNLPALLQPAHYLLLRDASVDGVLFAYGTHHIKSQDLPRAMSEAFRILKPGGRIVLQDFEAGTITARWYSEILDRYTLNGHKFDHFMPAQFSALLTNAGFVDVNVGYSYDPCETVSVDPAEAKRKLLDYLVSLFALEKLLPENRVRDENYWNFVEGILAPYAQVEQEKLPPEAAGVRKLTVSRSGKEFKAEFPRIALVGAGTKPAR